MLNKDFVKVVSEVNLFSHTSDNELLLSMEDMGDSLDILYDALSDELFERIEGRDINVNMGEWVSLVYLSKMISSFSDSISEIKGGSARDRLDDDYDIESIALVKEYLSYGAFSTRDSLYIDVGDLDSVPHLYIGNARDDGYVTSNEDCRDSMTSPINEVVAILLREKGIDREDLFHEDELVFVPNNESIYLEGDRDGYHRIKPDAIINKLGIHSGGRIVSVKKLLE